MTSLQTYSPEDIDEIPCRKEIRHILRPGLHRAYRSEYPAHKHEDQHEKKHHEHSLQHSVGIVRYDEAEACYENQEYHGAHIYLQQTVAGSKSVDKMRYKNRQGKGENAQDTVDIPKYIWFTLVFKASISLSRVSFETSCCALTASRRALA